MSPTLLDDIAVEVRDVTVRYGDEPVVTDVSFDVHSGEVVCLLGPSGCGKSTLLRIVAGFERPHTGAVHTASGAVEGPSPERVLMFQDSAAALFPWMTVAQNVAYPMRRRGMARSHVRDEVARLLTLVGLARHEQKELHEISGGMRQRVQLARSLAAEPAVLLMDEPFGALDAMTRAEMQRELARVVDETATTVVFVTHDVGEAVLLGDRVLVLSHGPRARLVAEHTNPQARAQRRAGETSAELAHSVNAALTLEGLR